MRLPQQFAVHLAPPPVRELSGGLIRAASPQPPTPSLPSRHRAFPTLAHQRRLTLRSSADPLRRATGPARPCMSIIGLAGPVPRRSGRLSSHVRPHREPPSLPFTFSRLTLCAGGFREGQLSAAKPGLCSRSSGYSALPPHRSSSCLSGGPGHVARGLTTSLNRTLYGGPSCPGLGYTVHSPSPGQAVPPQRSG